MDVFLIRWLLFSLVFHLLAGILSVGFYDFDEHFQILEFLNSHLNPNLKVDLPWEFHSKIRPWLQPFLYEGIARIFIWLKIQSPFSWVMGMRLASAFLGWMSVVGLALCCRIWFTEKWYKTAIRFLCLFWCIPYQHARTSSENLSGTVFWLMIVMYVLNLNHSFVGENNISRSKRNGWVLLLCGVLLGISFDFRYQMAFAIAGFIGWVLWTEKKAISILIPVSVGCLGSIGLGLLIDRWGYEQWVFTPWNYFYQNIVLSKASSFGVAPFNYYFKNIVEEVFPPVGLLLLLGVGVAWVLEFRHPLSFISFIFVLCHSSIGHKEQRFLYPILPIVPLLCMIGIQSFEKRKYFYLLKNSYQSWIEGRDKKRSKRDLNNFKWKSKVQSIVKVVVIMLLIFDLGALLISSLKPSSSQPLMYQAVYENLTGPNKELFYLGSSPYRIGGSIVHFYRDPELRLKSVSRMSELPLTANSEEIWLFNDSIGLPEEYSYMRSISCQLVYTTFPAWLSRFTFLEGPRRFASQWSLFKCQRKKQDPFF